MISKLVVVMIGVVSGGDVTIDFALRRRTDSVGWGRSLQVTKQSLVS